MGGYLARRWLLGIIAVPILLVGTWLWLDPDQTDRSKALAAACEDALGLDRAGMLEAAQAAYLRIADTARVDCATRRWEVEAEIVAAAAAAERGGVYVRSARLHRGDSAQQGRHHALTRAREGYIEALTIDPGATDARRQLRRLIWGMGGPVTREAANRRCAFADRLRKARLLSEAQFAYAQALRTGRTSSCVRFGLRSLRLDRAVAQRLLLRARALEAAGDVDEARPRYRAALAWDPTLHGAQVALVRTDGPDPQDATTLGQASNKAEAIGETVGAAGDATNYVTTNADAFGIGGAVLLLLIAIGMLALLGITRWKPGHDLVSWLGMPRFARKQLVVMPFTPVGQSETSQAIFSYWLVRGPADPDASADETVKRSPEALTDLWEAPAVRSDGLAEVAGYLGTSAQADVVAAITRLAQRLRPRRERRFSGQLLDRCEHGPGLRVIMTTRSGRPLASRVWWAADLPGPPLTEHNEDSEARHALAIWAATWARTEAAS